MIGIAVPAHNEEACIRACLRALGDAARHPGLNGEAVEIVVVLDQCSDATGVHAQACGAGTVSIRAHNVGMARAVGAQALLERGARWLAFTDADTMVSPSWLVDQLSLRYEPGCGTGELTQALSQRCDHLLASDFSPQAVEIACRRTRALANVQVVQHILPAQWPRDAGRFDLIVLSEVGYFLDREEMRRVTECCQASLEADGTLVACDWRPDFDERRLSTDEVHAALAALGLPRLVFHEEDDFVLQVWGRDGRSVAEREGIR